MSTKYFDHGHDRIAVVESESESDFDGFDGEIAAADLPADFGEWAVYERFAVGNGAVHVMSADGD